MARDTISIPFRSVPPSEFVLGPITVGAARQSIDVRLDCTNHLNSGVLLNLEIEISHDGGATWDFLTSVGRPGGVVFDEEGVADNYIRLTLDLPPERTQRRRVQCKVRLEGGSFQTTGGHIQVSD